MLKDILSGDMDVLEKYSAQIESMGGMDTLRAGLDWLKQADPYGDYAGTIVNEGWRLTYYRKPPTPEEFLTYEWIGPQAEGLWPNVKKCFIEFMDPNPLNPKRNLALSTSIGWGKSLLTNLVMSYLIVLFGLMREPYKQLGHNVTTTYALGLCCYTLNKAWDILGTPFEQFLEANPYFEKVGRHDDITAINREDKECKKCYYSTAARGSSKMIFRNNLNLKMVSTEGNLLGVTFIYTAMTELAWWVRGGMTHDDIYTFFTKADQRVQSRMNGHYLGRVVIDSSPFSMESPIDKFIWNEAMYDPKWYCVTGSKWDWFPEQFPKFVNPDGTENHNRDVAFQCFKGGAGEPPRMIENEADSTSFNHLDLVWCPKEDVTAKGIIQFEKLAKQNCVEFLRDYAGIPAGSVDRIFQNEKVLENMFQDNLRAIPTSITADYLAPPEHLIWNKIKDRFFLNFQGKYIFYRNPGARRVLSVDQSTTGDATAISMCHKEFLKTADGSLVEVTIVDFTIMIIPKNGAVSLDAVRSFIFDLVDIGGINLVWVNFDKFQSDAATQDLKRRGYQVEYVSADKKNEPYQMLINDIMLGRVISGKNIFLKNNLMSLHMEQRESGTWKYDHFKGKIINETTDISWETSELGVNAKDGADTVAECHYILNVHKDECPPVYTYEFPKPIENELEDRNKALAALGLSF